MLNNHNSSNFFTQMKEHNRNKFLARWWLFMQFLNTKEQLLFLRFVRTARMHKMMAYRLLKKELLRRKKRYRLKKAAESQRSLAQQQSDLLIQYKHYKIKPHNYDLSSGIPVFIGFMHVNNDKHENFINHQLIKMHYNKRYEF